MSKDMHEIKFMLDKAKELAASGNTEAAKIALCEMNKFYQEADIDGIAGIISKEFISEGEVLLEEIQPTLPKTSNEIAAPTFLARIISYFISDKNKI